MALEALANLSELLECKICMNDYQDSALKKPKLFPCQHSICFECLRNIVATGRRIECPFCRQICQNSIDEIPNNILLLQVMSHISSAGRSADFIRPSAPNSDNVLSDQAQYREDAISGIRRFCDEPGRLLPQLIAYMGAQKITEFHPSHILIICYCLELYARNAQQSEIIIVGMQILGEMIKHFSFVENVAKKRIFKLAVDVLKVADIRPSIRYSSIEIMYSLANEPDFQVNYTSATISVLLLLLGEPRSFEDTPERSKIFRVLSSCDFDLLQSAEKANMGSTRNIKRLLELIDIHETDNQHVITLLRTLCGITRSTQTACANFIGENGLDVVERLLKNPKASEEVCVTSLVLLSNISEIPITKDCVIPKEALLESVVAHFKSKTFATSIVLANIIANLCLVQVSDWQHLGGNNRTRNTALELLRNKVTSWIKKDPGKPLAKCSSLKPWIVLLQTYSVPPCQLYAAWSLRKYCNEDDSYKGILVSENGPSILRDIKENEYADKLLRKVVGDILSAIPART